MSQDNQVEPASLSKGEIPTGPRIESTAIANNLLCPQCGYNLRGLTRNRCPECGREFDPAKLTVSEIPWVHRRRIGRSRAYRQTIWLVTFHNSRFCREFARPVSYADAQRFRWVTVLLVYFSSLAVTLPDTLPDIWLTVALQLGVLLSLVAATGIPSYFFHPRSLPIEQQNRGVAMSYYACAPLAWTPVTLALCWLMSCAVGSQGLFHAAARGVVLVQLVAWWLCLILIAKRAMRRGPGGIILVALVMPVVWVLAVEITLAGARATVCFLGIVYSSLQS